jgi:nitrogen fixation protein FixH
MSNVVQGGRSAPMRPARSSWIPWIFVGGFVVIVAVNAIMVAYALKSFPGLADPAAYNHGVAYNAMLAEADRQEALGWRLTARLDSATAGDVVVVRATRADGAPLDGLVLSGRLTRPVDVPAAVDVALTALGDGVYRTRVELPRRGQWDLHVIATAGSERVDLRQRVFAP